MLALTDQQEVFAWGYRMGLYPSTTELSVQNILKV